MPEWIHDIIHGGGTVLVGILLYIIRNLMKRQDININVNLNLKKPGIMKKLIARLWNIPWIHALVMGAIGAVIGAIYPFINNWLQSQPVPSFKMILLTAAKALVAFILGYIGKHLIMGSSGPAIILPPVTDPGPSGSPVPPGGPSSGSSISQKGKPV